MLEKYFFFSFPKHEYNLVVDWRIFFFCWQKLPLKFSLTPGLSYSFETPVESGKAHPLIKHSNLFIYTWKLCNSHLTLVTCKFLNHAGNPFVVVNFGTLRTSSLPYHFLSVRLSVSDSRWASVFTHNFNALVRVNALTDARKPSETSPYKIRNWL